MCENSLIGTKQNNKTRNGELKERTENGETKGSRSITRGP